MEDKVYHEVHSFLLLRKRQSSSVIHILPQRYSSYSVALEEVYKMVCMNIQTFIATYVTLFYSVDLGQTAKKQRLRSQLFTNILNVIIK
ncbi:unnamed protein product [Rhizophagus irregularis]|nr:unnamed protein product [Rhizophagus irregularis]CAB5389857.1 unnamed protein product [Rhizophagus irregularis]